MKLLLDTNAISRFFAGDKVVLAALNQAETILLSIFVLGELWAGFYGGRKQEENRAILQRFMDKPNVTIIPADAETAVLFGHLKHQLAMLGKPIPINDIWIAAHALQNGAILATFDTHFSSIIGLMLYSFQVPT